MDPSMTIRTDEQAESIRKELQERRTKAKVNEARFKDRIINWTEDLYDELSTDAECELYQAFLAEEDREGSSDDNKCTTEECVLYEKYLAQEGRQARIDTIKKEIGTRLNKAINLILTGEDYDNDGAGIMGVVSRINKRRCDLESDNPEPYDEWERGTRNAIKELYTAIMCSEQCKAAEDKAANERRAMKNAFYFEEDYYKYVDREEKLVADEYQSEKEITAAITDMTEMLCCLAASELGIDCLGKRTTQLRKMVDNAVRTILAGMYRNDDDEDDDESYDDFLLRNLKVTKLYLGIIAVELRQAMIGKPFEAWGTCIDKYALLWIKKPGVTFRESLERRAIYNDWGKEEMVSKRKSIVDRNEEPSEGAHYLDKYVCIWVDIPGITYKEWVEEEKVLLREGKWLHDLGVEKENEAKKTKEVVDEMEDEEEDVEAHNSSVKRTKEWVKSQNEEREMEVENAKRELRALESLQQRENEAASAANEDEGLVLDGDLLADLYDKGMLPFQDRKATEIKAKREDVKGEKNQSSADKEKEAPGGEVHIMDPYVCLWDKRPGLTYKQWAEEQMEEQKRAEALMELKMDSADDMEEEEEGASQVKKE